MRAPSLPKPDLFTAVFLVAMLGLLGLILADLARAPGTPVAHAAPRPAQGAPEASAFGIHRDCRFEILPLDARFFPEDPRPHPSSAGRAVLLDQCSGQSWVLVPHGGPEEAIWRRLGRE